MDNPADKGTLETLAKLAEEMKTRVYITEAIRDSDNPCRIFITRLPHQGDPLHNFHSHPAYAECLRVLRFLVDEENLKISGWWDDAKEVSGGHQITYGSPSNRYRTATPETKLGDIFVNEARLYDLRISLWNSRFLSENVLSVELEAPSHSPMILNFTNLEAAEEALRKLETAGVYIGRSCAYEEFSRQGGTMVSLDKGLTMQLNTEG